MPNCLEETSKAPKTRGGGKGILWLATAKVFKQWLDNSQEQLSKGVNKVLNLQNKMEIRVGSTIEIYRRFFCSLGFFPV